MSNFQKYKSIRQSLDSIGVTLLNVSIDKDPKAWKAAISKHQIDGVHALSSTEEMYPQYQVSSIPL